MYAFCAQRARRSHSTVVVFNEEAELKKIKGAHKKVKNDIARLKEQFDSASAKIETPDIAKEEPAV